MKHRFMAGLAVTLLGAALVICNIRGRVTGTPVTVAGYGLTQAVSESMEPTLRTYGYAVFQTVQSADDLSVGDIILFHNEAFGRGANALFCHRIVSMQDGSVATRGDNNAHADPYRTQAEDVVGRIVFIFNGIPGIDPRLTIIGIIGAAFGLFTLADKKKQQQQEAAP